MAGGQCCLGDVDPLAWALIALLAAEHAPSLLQPKTINGQDVYVN
jgi:hypothetical protein